MKSRKRRASPCDPTRAVAYLRVSLERQGLGPEAQWDLIDRWATQHAITVVAEHRDHGVSGSTEIESRPGLVAAISDLVRLDAGRLVIAKRDRLARDVGVAALIEREVHRRGAEVVAADGNGNGSDAHAQLARGMADLFAAHEREMIRERTRAALRVKQARGERTGGIPLGYQLAEDGIHLLEHPEEIANIEEAVRLRGQGLSFRAIAKMLDAAGWRTRSGRAWDPQQVWRMVNARSPRSALSTPP